MRGQLVLVVLAALTASGCNASLRGGSIDAAPAAGAIVDGIPYRLRDQLRVEVYRMTDKGYVLVGSQTELMADPERLYVLNFEGRPLADASLKIDQRPDGSLSVVTLNSTGKGADLLTNAASGIDSLAATSKTLTVARKAATDAETAAAEAELAKAKGEIAASNTAQLDAVRTRDEAYRLLLKLDEDRASLKPSEILAVESAIRIAKMQANTAAIAAGQNIPFPDID